MQDEFNLQVEEIKLVYRSRVKASDRISIKSPEDAYPIFLNSWDQDQLELIEEFKAMFLDRSLKLMSIASISKGGYAGVVVDLRHIFGIALKRRAHSIILAHNHPSGQLRPSQCDISLTKKLIKAGEIMDISVEDHLIITKDGFTSICSELA